jgi:hypothetical protein
LFYSIGSLKFKPEVEPRLTPHSGALITSIWHLVIPKEGNYEPIDTIHLFEFCIILSFNNN